MFSAIRKFFRPQSAGQKQQEQDGQLQQKKPKRLHLGSSRRQGNGSGEEATPLRGGPACGRLGDSATSSESSSGNDNSNSSTSSTSASIGNENCNSTSTSTSTSSSAASASGEDQANPRGIAADGDGPVAEDRMAMEHQQQEAAQEQQPKSIGADEGDFDDDDYNEDYGDDDCRVAFIAEAAQMKQQPQHQAAPPTTVALEAPASSLQQQQQQQNQQPQQYTTRICSGKTQVDQLLTAGVASQRRRDNVRGNLEELRVAESVNYRPVVYKYSFRVKDVPANMRVFTDPDDRRIEAIARSCDSQIHLEKLTVRGPGSLKMRKVTIQSPDLHSLEKCCRQFDDRFPHFYVSGGLGQSSKSIQRVYVDELDQQQ